MKENLLKLKELTDLFQSNLKEYKNSKYDEANTRTQFIDRFFELLDWDIANKQGFSESYKDVVREDKVIIEGKPKAPDYSFRVGGIRKFFLEAKKPSVNIKDEIEPAFQIRRYGYTAKLPLCVLTDFEEFAIYDTRIKPNKNDKAGVGRIFYCTFDEYEKNFEFIYNTFSKNAILKGSFDQYAVETKSKKGTSEVDKEFLSMIEGWRESLAKNLALRNQDLDVFSLNTAVQILIDRIIFLRIAEDRNMERYGMLLEATKPLKEKSESAYVRFNQIFLNANSKYNSGLFHPEPWIQNLEVDDKVFQSIVSNLYYPECPYELSVMPIEILGNIYEQFLGKSIRLTSSHQAKVEEKEEVRKAGGVYYTPQYIVDYIIESTLGEKLEGVDLYSHPKLALLDPACGSGSFLVGAYTFLLHKYLEAYTEPKRIDKALKSGLIYQVSSNTYRLSITVKQTILLHHIYGVDIDPQAVEVTKLSLLLKLMEDENTESADRLFKHSQVKLLPDLSGNIKCGNSLVDKDFYEDKNLSLFGKEEMRKVNTFDWKENFPKVFAEGGFDVVVGNPPYVRQETLGEEFKTYAKKRFTTFAGTADLYVYFIEKSLSLLHPKGIYSIIVANKWMRANYGENLRKFLKTKRIYKIIDFGDLPVFKSATTYPCILKLSNEKPKNLSVSQLKSLDFVSLRDAVKKHSYTVDLPSLDDKGWSLSNQKESALLDKIKKAGIPLGEYVEGKIYRGVLTGLNEAFVIDEATKNRLVEEDPKSAEVIKPFLAGREIKRYATLDPKNYLIFTRRGIDIKKYPAVLKHLENFKTQLMPKPNNWPADKEWKGRKPGSYQWYEIQDAVDYYEEFEKEKIIYAEISIFGAFTLDTKNNYSDTTSYILAESSKPFLAILNSKIFNFQFQKISSEIRGGFFRWKKQYMQEISIPNLNRLEKINDSTLEKLGSLVSQVLQCQKELSLTKTDSDKKHLEHKAELLDKQIDALVYQLYGLDEEEIQIVEGAV
ncbi:MAG: Eco57I restriction-modification methylase domain-containing protein [Leptospira sp.]|uniref:Eco57I restriction-modification methylase domain-containing protein n=1 Tax=Leptospira sp. TaxID=178 RepID=UPI0025C6755D|nr:N-6 DNA methylase [Leptospira sp.]MBL0953577.1 Eco57I restriction-modification methylase domain-containing protein [Leptospira sp.]